MLSQILKKESCADCRFCCAFRRQSLWETPIFTKENKEAIQADSGLDDSCLIPIGNDSGSGFGNGPDETHYCGSGFENGPNETNENGNPDYFRYDLSEKYLTEDSEEEAACPYLDEHGCILDADEKPWDCKIWPLRVMKYPDGEIVIALTPTCPAINKLDLEEVRTFVKDNIGDDLFLYAKDHPYLIKEYKEGFPVLCKNGSAKQNGRKEIQSGKIEN